MSFFKKLGGSISSIATGGLYSTTGGGVLQGGNMGSVISNTTGGLVNPNGKPAEVDYLGQTNSAVSSAKARAKNKINKFYGNSLDNIGDESTDYARRTKDLLDKDVARADMVNTQGTQQRSLDNSRAGLYGSNLTAQSEQNRRNAGLEGEVINEEARRSALGLYGNSISNRISGANSIENQEVALALSSTPQPVQKSNTGIIGNFFSGLF